MMSPSGCATRVGEAELQRLRDRRRRFVGGEHGVRRIGQPGRDRLQPVDLLRETALVERLARTGHDGHREQVDRVDDDRGVDALRHLAPEQRRQPPRRVALLVALQRVPAGRLAIEELVDRQRRAEIDVHAPVLAPEVARDPHERAERLALLRLPLELGDQRAALEQLFVAEIHRHQQQRPRMLAHEALDGHAEQAALRRERAPAAAAAALDEVRDRKALGQHRVQVLAEHRGVQRLALEAPAQEERAAAPQQRAHDRKIQVGAGRDVRWREPLRMDEIRQQQVIDVAAVVGQIDEPLARRDLGELACRGGPRRRRRGVATAARAAAPSRARPDS